MSIALFGGVAVSETDYQFERYVGYKSHVITLVAGILLGISTNYIAIFFPKDIIGLCVSLVAVSIIGWFLFSRFSVPIGGVFQPLPKDIGKATFFAFAEDFDVLAKRFIFKANLGGGTFETLFVLPKSGLKKSTTIPSSDRCLPLSKEKHNRILKKTVDLLGLTDAEKAELQDSVDSAHEPFFVKAGAPFEYRNLRKRFLKGRGIFYLKEFGEPGMGCLIIPSSFSTMNRHFEYYHNRLHENINSVICNLQNDEEVRSAISRIFKAENSSEHKSSAAASAR